MTVKKAYQLHAGDIVSEIVARVVKIEPPRQQTPNQAKAGIHNQSIFLQDADGTEIRMVLIKPSIHLPMTDAGARFHFRSMNNDKGRLEGIVRKEWRKDNGETDHYLEANECCRFYMIKEDAEEGRSKIREERTTTGAHARGNDGPLTMHNVAEFYSDIVATLETRLNGSALWDALVRDPAPLMSSASSIFIECNKRGIMDRYIQHAPPTPQYEPPAPAPEREPSQPERGGEAKEPLEEIALKEALARNDLRDMRNMVVWEKVYDGLVEHIRGKGYEAAAVDAAYDHVRKVISRNGATRIPVGEVEYQIASDFDLFLGHVTKAQEILNLTREQAARMREEQTDPPQQLHTPESCPDEDWNPADTFTDEP